MTQTAGSSTPLADSQGGFFIYLQPHDDIVVYTIGIKYLFCRLQCRIHWELWSLPPCRGANLNDIVLYKVSGLLLDKICETLIDS